MFLEDDLSATESGVAENPAPGVVLALRDLAAAVGGVVGSVDVTGLGGSELGGTELMASVLALEDTQRRLDSVKAAFLGALVRSGGVEASTGVSVKRWKANRTHGSMSSVAAELRVAVTLQKFEGLAGALNAGEVSVDHVLAVAAVCNDRVEGHLIRHETEIVRFARVNSFRQFQVFLRRLVAMLDEDGPEPDCGDTDTASMGRDLEAHLHLRLELTGHNAVTAERVINAETDRQYRAAVREHEATGVRVPQMGVLRARAVMELIRRGAKANPDSPKPVVEAILPITVDSDGKPTGVHTVDGDVLDDLTAAVLLCDAHLWPVTINGSGNPLNLGRTFRSFTTGQRKALIVRDGGCVFPGCEQPASRCDAHHEQAWTNGGRTDLTNGAMLCRRHHGLVHGHNPWTMVHLQIQDLPPDLRRAHQARAQSARLEPTNDVRVWQTPTGALLLAQISIDHRGPAPPRQTAAWHPADAGGSRTRATRLYPSGTTRPVHARGRVRSRSRAQGRAQSEPRPVQEFEPPK